jgi:hypothetical protein
LDFKVTGLAVSDLTDFLRRCPGTQSCIIGSGKIRANCEQSGDPPLKKLSIKFSLLLSVVPFALTILVPASIQAQFDGQRPGSYSDTTTASVMAPSPFSSGGGASTRGSVIVPPVNSTPRPFSRMALGIGISPLGVAFQTTTNFNSHINLRGSGNFFHYGINNFEAQGFNVNGKINLASAGASVDYYPFHSGFRLSPGGLFFNNNRASANFVVATGTSFSLDDHNYYSATGANQVHGKGDFGLGNGRPAFTMTTGWGNTIPHSDRHFTFPFEIGAAFAKAPTVALVLTGDVCDAHGQNCVDVATDPTAQADLAAQVKKYQNNVNFLKTYPIVSFGVAYNFRTRSGGWAR